MQFESMFYHRGLRAVSGFVFPVVCSTRNYLGLVSGQTTPAQTQGPAA